MRSNSQGDQTENGGMGWTPELKRMNSGNSLTRPHFFSTASHFKQELCYVCNKKLKFATSGARCKDCKVICHIQCKDLAPLPCMATVNTPKVVKAAPGFISDYAPVDPPFVPAIIIHCINEVESRGLKQEGIYRVSGSDKEVRELKEKFIRGKTAPNLAAVADINVICSCLKDFLRNLKEPLITIHLWDSFFNAANKRDVQESTTELYQVISLLPAANRDTIAYLILHLLRVSESTECKMPVSNLITVFAPTIIGFSSSNPSSIQMMQDTAKQHKIMLKLMDLSLDYWSSFIRITDVLPTYHLSTPSSDKYRVLSKYEEPIGVPRNTQTPINTPRTPGLPEGGWFSSTSVGTGAYPGSYLKKTTQFFAPPILK